MTCPRPLCCVVALLPLLANLACKSKNAIDTGIIVEITSDLRVPAEINQARVMATDPRGSTLFDRTFDLGTGASRQALPLRTGLHPLHDTDAPIHIEAVGLLGGAPVVSRGATLSFLHGEQVLLTLPLLAVCAPVKCTVAFTTCKTSGQCESDTEVSSTLPKYTPNRKDAGAKGADVGPPWDAARGTATGTGTASGTGATGTGTGTWTSIGTATDNRCAGVAATCGPTDDGDCCVSLPVPGETFYLVDNVYLVTISEFSLDKYEVTVGRFRQFVNAGKGVRTSPPREGEGGHPKNPGSGWSSTWNASLAADTTTLMANLNCAAVLQTWTDTPGVNESMPINCLDWYTAFAFCAWDGGRLPTDAEWSYVRSGGSEQRSYPWSTPATSKVLDDSYAVYCGGTCRAKNVGSKSPKGDGKWGQSDLAGNVAEWVLDWDCPYVDPCNDCACLTPVENPLGQVRRYRGGAFSASRADSFATGYADRASPETRAVTIGVRCARSGP